VIAAAATAGPGPVASVSVDLDAIACYWRIHGLSGEPPPGARDVVLGRCLPRFAELFADAGIKATFFIVGQDLDGDAPASPAVRAQLAQLAADGHELASHSFSHRYDLVRRPAPEIADEIARAHDAIGALHSGPVGFRAPGYEISAALLDVLCERAYRYDSSAFPSLPYYGAKAGVMAAMRFLGRRSGSMLGSPRVLGAPLGPYHPSSGSPYRPGSMPILELPITVTPWLRLPVIGTSLVTAPSWLRRRLVATVARLPFVNLELHGIDLADAEGDGIPSQLVARQPDLRRPLAAKRAALAATLSELRLAGASFLTLADVAARLGMAAAREPGAPHPGSLPGGPGRG
jgi:peptidoglycan-N-acetylglucosamine deacetylase